MICLKRLASSCHEETHQAIPRDRSLPTKSVLPRLSEPEIYLDKPGLHPKQTCSCQILGSEFTAKQNNAGLKCGFWLDIKSAL